MNYDYLGMGLDFTDEGKVNIQKNKCITGIIEDSPENINRLVANPASGYIFQVKPENYHTLFT